MVIVPDELVCYIRQYTSHISLFYGRNIWGFMNNPTAEQLELYQLLHEENRDYQAIHDQAKAYGCHYIVFNPEAVPLPDDMETYGSECGPASDLQFGVTGNECDSEKNDRLKTEYRVA